MSSIEQKKAQVREYRWADADKALGDAFQSIDSSVLLAVVQGFADVRRMAARTLADRGLGLDGEFLGRQLAWERVPD